MQTRTQTWMPILLLAASTAMAGKIENFTVRMQHFRDSLNRTTAGDRITRERRSAILAAEGSGRRQAYESYLNARLDAIDQNRALIGQLDKLIDDAGGIDLAEDGTRIDLQAIMTGYQQDLASYAAELGDLKLELDDIAADATPEVGEALKQYQQTLDLLGSTLGEAMRGFADAGRKGDAFNADGIITPLRTLRAFLTARQKMQMIDFKATLASAKIHEFEDKLSTLYDAAFSGLDPAENLAAFGRRGIDVANWLETLNEMVKSSDMTHFASLHRPGAMKAAVASTRTYRDRTRPYRFGDRKYFYDPAEDRWFWLAAGKRAWAPFDWDAGTGLYVRRTDDGWFSFHPDYQEPQPVYPDELLEELEHEQPDAAPTQSRADAGQAWR